jgi:hypothetical protein
MRKSKVINISMLMVLILIGAAIGTALYTNYSVKASAPGIADLLENVPADCQFVLGVNVQRIVSSPAYARFRSQQSPEIGADLLEFIQKTGVDPTKSITYMVAAGRSGTDAKGEGVVVAAGSFNQQAITDYIRAKTAPLETTYAGKTILMIPENKGEVIRKGIVFLSERETALGGLASLKKVLDIRANGNKNILTNSAMAALIDAIDPEDMFWFVGDAAGTLANAPIKTPLGPNISNIRGVSGAFNVTDVLNGRMMVNATNADSARNLAEVARGFVALGQLSGDKNPDLKMLLGGVTIAQNSAQITMTLNVPLDLMERVRKSMQSRRPAGI